MKPYKNTSGKWMAGLFALCFLSVSLSSCLKNSNNNVVIPPAAFVLFADASPDGSPINLYFDNNQVNTTPIAYGTGIDYFKAYAGKRAVSVFNSTTASKLFSDTLQLAFNNTYSLFLINKAATPAYLLLTDTLTRPASTQAGIRFVNVSPDAPAVDFGIQDSTAMVTNKAYKGVSSFLPIKNKKYTFTVRQHGTNTILATLSGVTINSGLIYTVWLHGLVNTTVDAQKLKADILTNAYFQ